ncbi:hypothetical protein COCON_G00057800 [Conger conger]|uniref:Thymic stromal cotransporter homolog n=1 Tax=Conger conger TaxID=82655 RepID=A0A9Q1DRH6_CONCO|nr:hypothetical protein COCON_G00057800 [Conger conger]
MGGFRTLVEPVVILNTMGSAFYDTALSLSVYQRALELAEGRSDQAQAIASHFLLLYNSLCSLLSFVSTLVLGWLAHRHGPRLLLVLPQVGTVARKSLLLAFVLFRLPLEALYAGAAAYGLCGGTPAYWGALVSLASLTSGERRRSLKINAVDFCYGTTAVLGGLLSGHLYPLGRAGVPLIVMSILLCVGSLLYSAFLLTIPGAAGGGEGNPEPGGGRGSPEPGRWRGSPEPGGEDSPEPGGRGQPGAWQRGAESPEPRGEDSQEPWGVESLEPGRAESLEPRRAESLEPRRAESPEPGGGAESPEPGRAESPEPDGGEAPLGWLEVSRRAARTDRSGVVLLLVSIAVFDLGMSGAEDVLTLYVQKPPLGWDSVWLGYGSAATNAMYVSSFLGVVLLSRALGDTALILLGVASNCTGMAVMAFATRSWVYFFARGIMMFSCIPMPTIKAQMSVKLDARSYGRVFGWLQATLALTTVLSGLFFTSIYPLTLGWYSGFCFLTSCAISYLSVIPILYLHCRGTRKGYMPISVNS